MAKKDKGGGPPKGIDDFMKEFAEELKALRSGLKSEENGENEERILFSVAPWVRDLLVEILPQGLHGRIPPHIYIGVDPPKPGEQILIEDVEKTNPRILEFRHISHIVAHTIYGASDVQLSIEATIRLMKMMESIADLFWEMIRVQIPRESSIGIRYFPDGRVVIVTYDSKE